MFYFIKIKKFKIILVLMKIKTIFFTKFTTIKNIDIIKIKIDMNKI